MTEEQVTKAILACLINDDWNILAYDFPQSGTGKMLHPDESFSEKNKDGIIPDIVAVKGICCLFFENKDRTVENDFKKIAAIRDGDAYKSAITLLLKDYPIERIYYGIGLPLAKYGAKTKTLAKIVDFVVGVTVDSQIEWLHNPFGIET